MRYDHDACVSSGCARDTHRWRRRHCKRRHSAGERNRELYAINTCESGSDMTQRHAAGSACAESDGSTPISCSNGWNGLPFSKVRGVSGEIASAMSAAKGA